MNTTQKIPQFRTLNGLINWVVNNNWNRRLDSSRENLFLNSNKESMSKKASILERYAHHVGKLDPHLERIFTNDPRSLVDYQKRIHRDGHGLLPDDIIGVLKGKSSHLVSLARGIGRLPTWLEETIDDPYQLLIYSKFVLKGPLPENIHHHLKKDWEVAIRYGYDVIRGFSPCRLPDDLHTFLWMKSYENPDNEKIKQYLKDSRLPETEDDKA
jgi:hypothetical protein